MFKSDRDFTKWGEKEFGIFYYKIINTWQNSKQQVLVNVLAKIRYLTLFNTVVKNINTIIQNHFY